jgi:Protein of unknown function (DUF3499)
VATLTYVYADSTAVLGPLASYPEPHCYDLCHEHAEGLTAPRGWQVMRLSAPETGRRAPSTDDLEALALAVREAARAPAPAEQPPAQGGQGPGGRRPSAPGEVPPRRGHLRAVSDEYNDKSTARER